MAPRDRLQTPATRAQWLGAVDVAWWDRTRELASYEVLGTLWGQACIEHGRNLDGNGLRWIWNHNLGNVRWFLGAPFDFTTLDGAVEYDEHGNAGPVGGAFRSYPNLEAGAAGFLSLLADAPRYAAPWAELLDGGADPVRYVRALRSAGYFTGPLDVYQEAVRSIARNFRNEFRAELDAARRPDAPR